MIRLEIIHNYGGMYTGIDSRALKGFDEMFSNSFMTYNRKYKHMVNACFGFPKHSSFLLFLIRALKNNYNRHNHVSLRTGNYLLTFCYLMYNDNRINIIDPDYLTIKSKSRGKAYKINSIMEDVGGSK